MAKHNLKTLRGLSQEEYDSLPSSEKNNGEILYITPVENDENTGGDRQEIYNLIGKTQTEFDEITYQDKEEEFIMEYSTRCFGQPSDWTLTHSTFSGWGYSIGSPKSFEFLRFPVRARANPITRIQVYLQPTDSNGDILFQELLEVNVQPFQEAIIEWRLPRKFNNTDSVNLYFTFSCNNLCDVKTILNVDSMQDTRYNVNGNITKTPSQLAVSVNKFYMYTETGIYGKSRKIHPDSVRSILEKTNSGFDGLFKNKARVIKEYESGTQSNAWSDSEGKTYGWGGSIGSPSIVRALKFMLRAKNLPISIINFNLLKGGRRGQILSYGKIDINIAPEEEVEVVWLLDTPYVNTSMEELYLMFQCDSLCEYKLTTQSNSSIPVSYFTQASLVSPWAATIKDPQDYRYIYVEEGEFIYQYDVSSEFSSKISLSKPPIINLPSKINAVVGHELNIYFDNILENSQKYEIDIASLDGVGVHANDRYSFTPTGEGIGYLPTYWFIYDGETEVGYTECTIAIKSASSGTGHTRKVIVIGDSTTATGKSTEELLYLSENVGVKIELCGTLGTAPNLHEGRSGWSTKTYTRSASAGGIINPFYNEGFDFSHYMTTTGQPTPDYVLINLGINDIFHPTTDSSLQTAINEALLNISNMVQSIHAYNTSIKVGVVSIIPPSATQDAFGKSYGGGQSRRRYKRNHTLFIKALYEAFENLEAVNTYIVPVHTSLDTRNNMPTEEVPVNSRNANLVTRQSNGVHPAISGYLQIADSYYYWLMGFENN